MEGTAGKVAGRKTYLASPRFPWPILSFTFCFSRRICGHFLATQRLKRGLCQDTITARPEDKQGAINLDSIIDHGKSVWLQANHKQDNVLATAMCCCCCCCLCLLHNPSVLGLNISVQCLGVTVHVRQIWDKRGATRSCVSKHII